MGSNHAEAFREVNPDQTRVVDSAKVWTTLITNTDYLPGLLALDYSLKRAASKYPLIALYTDAFPEAGHRALDARGIPKKHIPYLLPNSHKDYTNDPRFYDCWSKLAPFSLVEYERVVQLDSDMLVVKNMDELMDLELDPAEMEGKGHRVFAASHACVCNPMKKSHYPADWIPANCAFTTQHSDPERAQTEGASPTAGLGMPNGGLQVVNPSVAIYSLILQALRSTSTEKYDFADQSLLSDLFHGRWVALPYIYNALKTMRWKGLHDGIWRDECLKNVHYLLSPKPWEESREVREGPRDERAEINRWWWEINEARWKGERARGIDDGF
ncbi:glycosyltransferase family 8 protein [Aplosporella prunicola CBS 121167]|uniref:Glycosyltransferase family 8 protein n=1 Tax=Aplosporella prunicola CBS 121167 TaxID=1176127 RepID=A0A6A6B8K6_9PEZI|nr:glycosyltransferase family 8 protein [Aplosporella prunicola CBS 121167]KAF2140499.1 glycosyltransferase family 8 protein [Aplosporella prunicola CBS 121167]